MRSKQRSLSYVIALALSASGAVACADTISGGTAWQSWDGMNLATASSPSNPYWNNVSGDGPNANVGWCMTGGGSCTMATGAPGPLSYYGNGNAAPSTMFFTSSGTALTLTLQTLMTDQTSTAGGFDVFGYYVTGDSATASSGVQMNPLFDSRTAKLGATATINTLTTAENYGFYIENIQGYGTPDESNYFYLMDSTSNSSTGSMPADSQQHFAVFSSGNGSGTYYLGDVDDDACANGFTVGTSPCVPSNQFDFNNMMVEVTPSPEPASLALMGIGLCLFAALVRRNKNRTSEN